MIKPTIGVIREGKTPPDSRVPLTPAQCKLLVDRGYDLVVQPSAGRCYKDSEYEAAGIVLSEDLGDRDILLGVKEVPIDMLIPNKTYFFFSHTIKKQAYNQPLLKACVDKGIRLVDYEVLTGSNGGRVIAFGRFAGMVGAHNALWTYGQRTGTMQLPRMHTIPDYAAAKEVYQAIDIPPCKIVLTGTGRVAGGAAEVLQDMGITKVSPVDFLLNNYDKPVFTQLNSFYYVRRKDGAIFDTAEDFYKNPDLYESDFHHLHHIADIMINGIYWDNAAPAFFTLEDIKKADWSIKVIADITCDIAPVTSIPTTIKATTIADPIFGYDRFTDRQTTPHLDTSIDMMTIDNLPNELPRDASAAFGQMFVDHVLLELGKSTSELIDGATITRDGDLGKHFEYLRDYLNGKDNL